MRVVCESARLTDGLMLVSHALASKLITPIYEGVLMETCPEGLRLSCTDMDFGIETIIEATVAEEGRIVLPGRVFIDFVRKLPPAEVSISVSDDFLTTVKCLRSRISLTGLNPGEFPDIPSVVDGNSFSIKQRDLRYMIQKTSFAVALDQSRPLLMGCLLEIEQSEIRMVALDGFRLALRSLAHEQPIESMQAVIPGKMLTELAKVLDDTDDDAAICISKAFISVEIGVTRVSIRLLDGEYTRYRRILPTEWQTRIKINKNSLIQALERTNPIAREGKNNLVRFHIEEDSLTIVSTAEMGEANEQIDILSEGNGIDISFNIRYMSDVIKIIDEEDICLRFNSNVSPCEICPAEGDRYLYLVLPVRVT